MLALKTVSILVAIAVASTVTGFHPASAAVPSDGTLFAFKVQATLITLDPASGAQHPVRDLSTLAPNANVGPLEADQHTARLFTVMSSCSPCGIAYTPTDRIVTINSTTSAVRMSPTLPQRVGGGIAMDPATDSLWAVTDCYLCASESIVKVNPRTGAETSEAVISSQIFAPFATLALAPASHALYMTFDQGGGPSQLFTLNTDTNALTAGPSLSRSIRQLVYDTSADALFGITSESPQQLVAIDPSSGNEAAVGAFSTTLELESATIDSLSHTVYATEIDPFKETAAVLTIDDQSGTNSVSASAANDFGNLAFQATQPTPGSIKAEVTQAFTNGSIKGSSLEQTLLFVLNVAGDAYTHRRCVVAFFAYSHFVDVVERNAGTAIDAPIASKLVADAQSLGAGCV